MSRADHIYYKKNSFRGAEAITPSNTVDLTDPVSAIFVGVAGDIKLTTASGETVTFANVPVGIFEVTAQRVFATGTAATNLIGLK